MAACMDWATNRDEISEKADNIRWKRDGINNESNSTASGIISKNKWTVQIKMPGEEQRREWVQKCVSPDGSCVVTKTVHTKTFVRHVETSSSNGTVSQGLVDDVVKKLKNFDDLELNTPVNETPTLSDTGKEYFLEAAKAEAWMAKQRLSITAEHRGKDELSAQGLIQKDEALENAVNDYADKIRELRHSADQLKLDEPESSEVIEAKQAQIEHVYAALKDLVQERRSKLEEAIKLFMLNRKIDDLKRWFAEKDAEASSKELGKDYEDVKTLLKNFKEFADDTETIGTERMASVESTADALIRAKHSDAASISLWKDGLKEAWADLLERIDTRAQTLESFVSLHKFYHDCREVLGLINEKQAQLNLSDDVGRDALTMTSLQRKHDQFLEDLKLVQAQVNKIQADSKKQQAAHAGDKAKEIVKREAEVMSTWKNLEVECCFLGLCEARKTKMDDTGDLIRLFNIVRTLTNDMDDVIMQMYTADKSGDSNDRVELRIKNHENLKAEIQSREDKFLACTRLSNELIARNHHASAEIKDKIQSLTNQRKGILKRLDERIEGLKRESNGQTSLVPPATPKSLGTCSTPGTPMINGKKDARSKLAFRSFRRKKDKQPELLEVKQVASASDDDLHIEKVKERRGTIQGEDELESVLVRKHQWETLAKKSSHRSWEKLYTVLRADSLHFYKDQKSSKIYPNVHYRGENPLALVGPSVEVASDYTKRKHVFRLKLASGAEYLLQAKDDEEMSQWVSAIQKVAHKETDAARLSKTQTLPASSAEKVGMKNGSLTMKK